MESLPCIRHRRQYSSITTAHDSTWSPTYGTLAFLEGTRFTCHPFLITATSHKIKLMNNPNESFITAKSIQLVCQCLYLTFADTVLGYEWPISFLNHLTCSLLSCSKTRKIKGKVICSQSQICLSSQRLTPVDASGPWRGKM